jgi:DNA modification methylase
LVPYARNSRTHSDEQLAQIAASMREFGFTNPVLIDEQGGIVAGHGRVMAAQRLGMAHVPCLRLAGLTEAQRRAYVIADNQIALNAGWDDAMLRLELADLQAADFNLDLLGFDADRLDELLADDVEETESLTDADEVPEAPEKPATRPGDVWLLGRHRVMCGDSTSAESWEKLEPPLESLTFTSPPYGAANVAKLRDHYVPGAEKRESFYNRHDDDPAGWLDLMRGWTSMAMAHTKATLCNVQMLADNKRDMVRWLAEFVDHLVDVVVWDKVNGAPQMQANVLTNAFEFVFVLSSEPGASRAIPFADFHGTKRNTVQVDPRGKNEFAAVHRAVMPVDLVEWAIGLCEKARTFVDPFGGTGTTLMACEKHNRTALLIELDPRYCDVIINRWQDFTGQQATLEATGQTFDEVSAGA